MSTSLRVVTAPPNAGTSALGLTERIRKLQAEARDLAREQVEQLKGALLEVQHLSEEIAQGGDAYPPGVRDLTGRLGEEIAAKAQTLDAIMCRA